MSAILKSDFQKRKQSHFSEENYLIKLHKKRHNFACDHYIFPKTRSNKNKQWTHMGALNVYIFDGFARILPPNLLTGVNIMSFRSDKDIVRQLSHQSVNVSHALMHC